MHKNLNIGDKNIIYQNEKDQKRKNRENKPDQSHIGIKVESDIVYKIGKVLDYFQYYKIKVQSYNVM